MTRIYIAVLSVLLASVAFSQEEEKKTPDTTRVNLGKTEILIIEKGGAEEVEKDSTDFEEDFEEDETVFADHSKPEPHWAGVDFGFTMLMNSDFDNSFPDYPYWENDAARSQVWNLNLLEHKFNIGREYFGVTTGLGFSFTSVAIKGDYLLRSETDTLYAEWDSTYTYSKNKLKASYLTVPLLLEFNTNINPDKSFYLATGVVGGVRIGSRTKRIGELDGKEFKQKDKGTYNLNPFKLDAVARLGYNSWGVFASYSLLSLFEDGKTANIYPLTFGLSFNF